MNEVEAQCGCTILLVDSDDEETLPRLIKCALCKEAPRAPQIMRNLIDIIESYTPGRLKKYPSIQKIKKITSEAEAWLTKVGEDENKK